MKGQRIYPKGGVLSLPEGGYGIEPRDGLWYARPPSRQMGCLGGHDVTEHGDGTITVSPSILIDEGPNGTWHGYLENGIWREV